MANLTFLASYADLASQYEQAYEQNTGAMGNISSLFGTFQVVFIVVFIIAIIAFVAAGVLALLTARAKLKTEKEKVEAAKLSANADMLEAHIKAADQQNAPLLRALMSNFSKEELLSMLNEVNKDTQQKVSTSNYTNIVDDDSKLDKEIDTLLDGFFKGDKDDDK